MKKATISNWWSGIKKKTQDLFLRLCSAISKFGSRSPQPKTPPNTTAKPRNEPLDDESFHDTYLKNLSGMDDTLARMGLHERLGISLKYFYEMGRRDGALGIRLSQFADLARSNAQEVFQHHHIVLKGRLQALQAEALATDEMLQADQNTYEREERYYDYVKYQYRFFPRSHSIFLFILYLVVALLLILADIPLALGLIREGFNLSGKELKEMLQQNFWNALSDNWEVFLTAMGISLCTVYIKIYYDEVVGTPFANRFMIFKQFTEENKVSQEEEKEEVEKEHRRKFRWKTAFFAITLLSIVALAFFRLEIMARSREVSFYQGAASIAITILFPLIGGICLSYSLNNLQNLTRLWKARITNREARERWTKAVQAATAVKKNLHDVKTAEERHSHEAREVEEYRTYLLASYERGYAIGGMQPQKYTNGQDFFTKILEWRNLAVSKNTNQHISNLGN